MSTSYAALRSEYETLLSRCKSTKGAEAIAAARHLIKDVAQYRAAEAATGVPACVIMALNMRESDGNMHTYLGNGESLAHKTHLVPRGRGPFSTWAAGAIDALHYDHLDAVAKTPEGWSWPRTLYECELWNGFGYRAHGVHSPYLWAGTNIQQHGKFVSDGHWSSSAWDSQLGVVPIMLAIISIDGSLAFATAVPASHQAPPAPQPPPHELGGETAHDVKWVQETLNHLGYYVGTVDGSFGRKTRRAVREFQAAHKLKVDGLVGDQTLTELETERSNKEDPQVTEK